MKEIISKIYFILGFLIIIVVVWISFSVYWTTSDVDVNPAAQNLIAPINKNFDVDVLDNVRTRVSNSLPVQPDIFQALDQKILDAGEDSSSNE